MQRKSKTATPFTPKWTSKTNKLVQRFGATLGKERGKLSNFSECGIKYTMPDGTRGHFSSSEHVWQALKANKRVRSMFLSDGQLSKLSTEIFKIFFPKTAPEKLEKKCKYWLRNGAVGILAKMASNKKYAKRLGIAPDEYEYEMEHLPEEKLREIWLPILRAKYTQNDELKRELLDSRHRYLLEFDRGAGIRDSFWGGMDSEDGRIVGNNFMGRMLMQVRDELLREEETEQ